MKPQRRIERLLLHPYAARSYCLPAAPHPDHALM